MAFDTQQPRSHDGAPRPQSTVLARVGPRETETLAIVGFVLSFVIWPVASILSWLALGRIKRDRTAGRGLAIAGLAVSAVGALGTAALCALLALGSFAVEQAHDAEQDVQAKNTLSDVGRSMAMAVMVDDLSPSSMAELAAAGYPDAQGAPVLVVRPGGDFCLSITSESGATFWFSAEDGMSEHSCA